MRIRTVGVITSATVLIAVLYGGLMLPARPTPTTPAQDTSVSSAPSAVKRPQKAVLPAMSLSPSEPRRLRIEALGIDAPLRGVRMTKTGEMESPKDKDGIVWYRSGFLPGSVGNAVIAAHSWHKQGAGAFYGLHKLAPGDSVVVTTLDRVLYFTVTHQATYMPDAPPQEAVFGADTKARLNLITCAGDWHASSQQYSERLVVFTEFDHEEIL